MARDTFISAEVTACNLVQHAAQLINAVVDAKHTGRSPRGGEVYIEAAAEEIATIREMLARIEADIGLVEPRAQQQHTGVAA